MPAAFSDKPDHDVFGSLGGLKRPKPSAQARLLIVDDEPINVLILKKCLHEAGYANILTSTDPRNVLTMVMREQPDVILLDLVMPEISGLTLLSQIRADEHLAHIPVIVVTGSDDEEARAEALELGATDLLCKPFRPTDLTPRVRNALVVKSHYDHLRAHALEMERQVRRRTAELAASRLELIHCLARIVEYRDNETGRHVIRVGRYSGIIARKLGMDSTTVELIEHAAPLHDIGKIGVPDSILMKPGKLSPDELEIMQRHVSIGKQTFEPMSMNDWKILRAHTLVGESIMDLASSPLISMAAQIALTHHERWDGAGYPLGLAGEDIPIAGRIVAVADVFDALSSKRPYKPPFPLEKCFEIISENRGKHFDPRVVDAFLECRDQVVQVRIECADSD